MYVTINCWGHQLFISFGSDVNMTRKEEGVYVCVDEVGNGASASASALLLMMMSS